MITILSILIFLCLSIAVIISSKSAFKLIFSFLMSLGVYIFLINTDYLYSNIFLTFSSLLHLLIIIYVKFSQTGKVRVNPTARNIYSNNISSIVSIILSSLLVLTLIRDIPDDLLIGPLTPSSKLTMNLFLDNNVSFVLVASILMIVIHVSRNVGEK